MANQKHENPMSVRSKSALAQSMLTLMMEKSIDDIAITDITDGAGLSRQTFYTNFNKKEDIIRYLLDRLFSKYRLQLASSAEHPSNIILDFFMFWDKNKDFLTLLQKHGISYLFQERNRRFFIDESEALDNAFTAEAWQIPYIKASLAGITNELILMWIKNDQGLSIDMISAMTSNLLNGKIFSE